MTNPLEDYAAWDVHTHDGSRYLGWRQITGLDQVDAGSFDPAATFKDCNMAIDDDGRSLGSEVYQILREARAGAKRETRIEDRYPFFRPVTIEFGEARMSGFCREVSERGIGLLHFFDLASAEVSVTIRTEQGYQVQARVRIAWCTPCGEGAYISGGEFIGISRVGV